MGRSPNPELQNDPYLLEAKIQEPPTKHNELRAAHEIARSGRHDLGISYAMLHVPFHLKYTIATLKANRALDMGDEAAWLTEINSYLGNFGAEEIQLGNGKRLINRFTTRPLPRLDGGPLVSIIMPAWNAEKTLRAAAMSILEQTWGNLELLIVDDASSDRTWPIMQKIAATDRRVKIFRNKINVGPYVSKNIMLSVAKGEWITGHDADDWAHPQRIEHHCKAILHAARPPRASLTYMLRLEANGKLDRFAPICDYSLDGIARDSAISCTYEASFLRNELGGWDNVKLGADSELIARAQKIIGDEFTKFRQIGMLCMNLEGSLTNHPEHGVARTTGPSQTRKDYSAAWMKWHNSLEGEGQGRAKISFPPAPDSMRHFSAPDVIRIPICNILRNHEAHLGLNPISEPPVTAICASKRPWFVDRVAAMMRAQTHRNLHVIYVAHGPGHDLAAASRAFSGIKSVQVLEVQDQNITLGDVLNHAISHCTTDLVSKIDDDDFYGPNYIRSSLAALKYSGHEHVGIVGRERAYCYVEKSNTFAIRYEQSHENAIRSRVFGGTLFWSRAALNDQRFISSNTGEDSAFFRDACEKGIQIYSTESHDYIHMRYARKNAHTWSIEAEEFLRPATVLGQGIRLDWAYSSKEKPAPSPVPYHHAERSGS